MKYSKLISQLTNRERARMLTGKDNWHLNDDLGQGLPSIMLTDGPHGLRKSSTSLKEGVKTVKATCFPTASALACTWDKELMHEIGNALAEECVEEKVSVLLGPGVNIKRNPLCGRNFEYFSEDPVVAGELSAELINGVQQLGVGTSLKHFAANNTENRRMKCNAIVDERALREIYTRPFEIAIKKAMPWSVMCAYNKVNGTYCTENSYLIQDVLRDDCGYEGVTISDWMAVDNRINALKAELDLEMPATGKANVNKIAKAIRKNKIDQSTLDKSVSRIFDLIDKSEENLEQPYGYVYDRQAHHALAQKAAGESVVLLKNDDYVLPLKPKSRIAVIGNQAKEPLFQGYGSSKVNPHRVDTAFDALKYAYPSIKYAKGYTKFADKPEPELIDDAKNVASSCDVAVVFVGAGDSDVSEGFDRIDMKLSDAQNALVDAVCEVNRNVIVIVTCGACVEMPWHNKVKAIALSYLLGEGGGVGLANVLVGNISPSGKLAETFPISFEDTPAKDYYKCDEYDNLQFREGIYVGYRYYEKVNKPVLFPFGHGLSYTLFNYNNMSLSSNQIKTNDVLYVDVEIENTGYYKADEVVQLYISKQETFLARPIKELKAFERVTLNPGESKIVKFALDRTAFEYFSAQSSQWHVESGIYDIYVGSSSSDIRLMSNVNVISLDEIKEIDDSIYIPNYYNANLKNISDEEFEDVIGHNLSEYYTEMSDVITSDCTLSDIEFTQFGKKIIKTIKTTLHVLYAGDEISEKMMYSTLVDNLPLKRFSAISKGAVNEEMIDAFIHLLNNKKDKKGAANLAFNGILSAIKDAIPMMIENKRDSN